MRKTLVTLGALGIFAFPTAAEAANPVYANVPTLSGSMSTGRIIATGGSTSNSNWEFRQKIECRLEKRFGNRWINNVFAPGGRRTSSSATKFTITQAAESGTFRLRCRSVQIHNGKGYVVYGKWVQSQAVQFGGAW